MAYDEGLAQRLRETLADGDGLTERRMFGGIAFMLHGNMAVGVSGDELMVRVGPEGYDEALAQPHARVFRHDGSDYAGLGSGGGGRRSGRCGAECLGSEGRRIRAVVAAEVAPPCTFGSRPPNTFRHGPS